MSPFLRSIYAYLTGARWERPILHALKDEEPGIRGYKLREALGKHKPSIGMFYTLMAQLNEQGYVRRTMIAGGPERKYPEYRYTITNAGLERLERCK